MLVMILRIYIINFQIIIAKILFTSLLFARIIKIPKISIKFLEIFLEMRTTCYSNNLRYLYLGNFKHALKINAMLLKYLHK